MQAFSSTNQLVQSMSLNDLVYDFRNPVFKGLGDQAEVSINYQQSAETQSSKISNASCFLIRNQNDRDLDGIAVYYDKIFSTFMFQRLLTGPRLPALGLVKSWRWVDKAVLIGQLVNWRNLPVQNLKVRLRGPDGKEMETSSNVNGRYSFYNAKPGTYSLLAGDTTTRVILGEDSSPFKPTTLNVQNVRRVLNLKTAPVWEVAVSLDMPIDRVLRIGRSLGKVSNERTLIRVADVDRETLIKWKKEVVFDSSQEAEQARLSEGAFFFIQPPANHYERRWEQRNNSSRESNGPNQWFRRKIPCVTRCSIPSEMGELETIWSQGAWTHDRRQCCNGRTVSINH